MQETLDDLSRHTAVLQTNALQAMMGHDGGGIRTLLPDGHGTMARGVFTSRSSRLSDLLHVRRKSILDEPTACSLATCTVSVADRDIASVVANELASAVTL